MSKPLGLPKCGNSGFNLDYFHLDLISISLSSSMAVDPFSSGAIIDILFAAVLKWMVLVLKLHWFDLHARKGHNLLPPNEEKKKLNRV